MSLVGVIALIAGALLLVALLAGPLHTWQRQLRREQAELLRGTAGLRVLGAEERRVRAARMERAPLSDAQAERAADVRESAEVALEQASRDAARARRLDHDHGDHGPADPLP